MTLRYEYIHFVKIQDKPKTSVWSCRNNRSGRPLGIVEWYSPWRQYCYTDCSPILAGHAVYSRGCLADIAAFLAELAKERVT